MDHVIVEVHIPAIGDVSDFLLPGGAQTGEIARQMAEALETVKRNVTFPQKGLMLCDLDTGRILHAEWTVCENGVTDGSRLMLL